MDPFSITASTLTLATACVKSSALLYKAIEGFRSARTDVQNLRSDVGDLNIVLQALEKNIQESTENFEVLKLILQQCADACETFHKAVLVALGQPDDRLQGIKAWVRLQYHGSNIESFRKLIGSYKATMTIALADSNLRTSKATKELLEAYTEMTKTTASNLEDQIDELSARLDLLRTKPQQSISDVNGAISAKQTRNQKASLEQCLSVCQQLLEHIETIKPSVTETMGNNPGEGETSPKEVTMLGPRIAANALEICTQNLRAAEIHLRDLHEGHRSQSKSDEAQVIQKLTSAQQCLDIVKDAQQHRVNIFEQIDVGDDSHQIIVSTIGDLIKANGLTIGARTVNIMGQMSDESLQRVTDKIHASLPERSPSPHGNVTFEKRYGYGKTVQQGRE